MSNLLHFPIQCSAARIPALAPTSLRKRAMDNFYTAERRAGVDPLTAFDRMCAFGDDLDRIADRIGDERLRRQLELVETIMGQS